jgi:hypothetical protein
VVTGAAWVIIGNVASAADRIRRFMLAAPEFLIRRYIDRVGRAQVLI